MPIAEANDSVQLEGLAEILAGLGADAGHADARARRQAAIVAFGRRTIARPALAVLMQDAVALVGEILGTGLAGVTEVTDRGRNIVTTVASIDSSGQMTNPVAHRAPLNPLSSMAAFALTMANTVVTSDLPAETAYQDMFLRKLGVRSALCVPIHLNREPLGVVGVYCSDQRDFEAEDIGFAESISHLLAATIARVHAEDELAQQRQLAQSVLDTVDSLIITLDQQGRVLRINGASEQLLGFELAEVEGKPFAATLLKPRGAEPFKAFLRDVLAGREPRGLDLDLVTKDGNSCPVRLRGTLLAEQTGNRATILLSGVDRTEITRLADELLRTRAQAGSGAGESGGPESPAVPETGAFAPFHAVGAPTKGHEMRSSPRRTYQYRQLIAPLTGDRLPSRNHFFEVVCEDISAGGISFYLDTPPDFKRVVVGLGQPPQLSFFIAEIVRVLEKEIDGQEQFLVGCRFTGRIRK
ncbi:MAG: PAS domain-containing protein [Thermoguttaceae bacterium]|jgi:PAS domain S-box-containing protein|nr:PAS domain-containing protein [Thermoguttaceae bacterium]